MPQVRHTLHRTRPDFGAPAPGSAPPAKQAVKAPPAKGSPAPTAHAAPKHAVQPTAKTARPTGNGPIRHKSSTKAAGAATTPGRQSSQKRLLILGAVAGLVIVASLGAWFAFFHKTEQPRQQAKASPDKPDSGKPGTQNPDPRKAPPETSTSLTPFPSRDPAAEGRNEMERERARKQREEAEAKILEALSTTESAAKNEGEGLATLTTPSQLACGAACFSPTEALLASSDVGGAIYLWDLNTGQPHTLKANNRVDSLAFSPDGKVLASAGAGKSLILWDVEMQAGTTRHTLTISGDSVKSLAFSADGKVLASAGNSGLGVGRAAVQLWDPVTGKLLPQLKPASGTGMAAGFRPHSSLFVTLDALGTGLRFHDAGTGQEVKTPFQQPKNCGDFAFSPDGWKLALAGLEPGGQNAFLTIFDLETGAASPVMEVTAAVQKLAWSPDGKLLVGADDKGFTLWDAATHKMRRRVTHTALSPILAFSPGGTFLVTEGKEGEIKLWAIADLLDPNTAGFADLKKLGELKRTGKTVSIEVKPDVTDEECAALAKAHVTEIKIAFANKLTDAGLAHLKGLKDLRTLQLTGAQHITDAGLAHLAGLTGLTSLDLAHTKITGAGLAHLKGLIGLRVLNLSETPLDNAALANLAAMTEMRDLDLSKCKIDYAGIMHLKGMTKLKRLVLTGTAVTAAIVPFLKGLPDLASVSLEDTAMTATAVTELKKSMPKVEIAFAPGLNVPVVPEYPELKGIAEVGPAGDGVAVKFHAKAKDADLAKLKKVKDLRMLILAEMKDLTDAGLAELKDIKDLRGLNLMGAAKVTSKGLENLAGLTGLTSLDLGKVQAAGHGLAYLKGLTQLESLNLSETGVKDADLAPLAALTNLKHLMLAGCALKGDGLVHLKGLTALELLDLQHNPALVKDGLALVSGLPALKALNLTATGLTDASLEQLKPAKELLQLFLGGTKITDAGLAQLTALENLQELYLIKVAGVKGPGLKKLEALKSLTGLSLDGTVMTDAGLEGLKGLTQLHVLGLPDGITDAGLAHLVGLTNLESVQCGRSPAITGPGLKHLAKLPALKVLDLGNTGLSDAGLENVEGFKELHRLFLPHGVGNAGLEHLKRLGNLEILTLPQAKVTDAGLVHLKELKNLKELQLSAKGVTDAGLAHFKDMTGLQYINFAGSKVTKEGVAALQKDLPNLQVDFKE